ncbi:trichohyalin-like [Harmonia axyridis]|uniref:trichohyalin-like n=1 Tax=Harmonia axyridis TaxID=115357 RepID=UPI001E278ADE|nr:trichohyalin-like [Harmonia axyridis]
MQIDKGICVLPKRKWNSLTNWLTEKQREKEKQEKERLYLKYMKEMSTALVAGHDSKKEAAAKRLDDKKNQLDRKYEALTQDYLRIKENQKMERQEIVKKYQRETIINRTPTLELSRALREAKVLHEREKDIELRKEIREKEEEMEEKETNELKRQWKAHDIFQQKKEENQKCRIIETKAEVWKQCQENRRKKQEEYKNQVNQEKMDLSRMTEELENKEEVRREQLLSNKKKALSLLKKAAEDAHHRRHSKKKEEQELYKVNEVINNVFNTRNCLVTSSLKKEARDRVSQHEESYVKYISQLPPIEPSEEIIFQNGVRHYQKEYERKMEEKLLKHKKHSEDRINNYKDDMRRQKIKEDEEAELKRMEMMERYKKAEAMKHLDEVNRKEEIRQKKNYGQELLRQAEEQKFIRDHEKKLEDEYVAYSFSQQDDHFAEYADEVISFAKDKKWSTVPIRKVIENYKKTQPLILRKRTETPCGKKLLLSYKEQFINVPSEVQKKFVDLDSQLMHER